jgi:hypothetical protein
VAKTLIKQFGFSASVGFNEGPGWDRVVGSYESQISEGDIDDICYTGYNNWNGNCYECTDWNGLCQTGYIRGRDAHVKYIRGSVAIGFFLPIDIGERFSVVLGSRFRAFWVKEGKVQFGEKDTFEFSPSIYTKFRWAITKNGFWNKESGLVMTVETPLSGFEYERYGIGYYWRPSR